VEFVSDVMSYTEVAGVISLFYICKHQVRRKVMIQHFSYEEIEQASNHFPNYHTKIVLGDFNAKWERNYISKPTIENESIHQNSNDNAVRVVNLALHTI
jgi:hypothetical protein